MTKKKDLGNNYYKSGWQPSIDFDEQAGTGEITHVGQDPNYKSKFNEILKEWGFDPEIYEIEGSVKASSWNTQLKGGVVETFYAFKGIVKKKNPARDEWFDKLNKEISKKPKLKYKKHGGSTSFIFTLSDWQLGKTDYGVENAVARLELALANAVQEIKNHNKLGNTIDAVYLLGLGDITENCNTHYYDSQAHNVSLNLKQQYHLARKLIIRCVDTFLPMVDKIFVHAIPGNHGEMTRSSKGGVLTSRLDNSDTMHFEIVGEILANNDRYKKVTVDVSKDFHQNITIHGHTACIIHGHMAGGQGSGPAGKIMNWWKGQMAGNLEPGDASILISGHYHHFQSLHQNRLWVQCSSLDMSDDFTARTGLWSEPGVLTMTINKDGWDNLKIL